MIVRSIAPLGQHPRAVDALAQAGDRHRAAMHVAPLRSTKISRRVEFVPQSIAATGPSSTGFLQQLPCDKLSDGITATGEVPRQMGAVTFPPTVAVPCPPRRTGRGPSILGRDEPRCAAPRNVGGVGDLLVVDLFLGGLISRQPRVGRPSVPRPCRRASTSSASACRPRGTARSR